MRARGLITLLLNLLRFFRVLKPKGRQVQRVIIVKEKGGEIPVLIVQGKGGEIPKVRSPRPLQVVPAQVAVETRMKRRHIKTLSAPGPNAPKRQPCDCYSWVKRTRRTPSMAEYYCTGCQLTIVESLR